MRHDVNKSGNKMPQIVPDDDYLDISDEDLFRDFHECVPEPSSLSENVLNNPEHTVSLNHSKKAHKK